jgi:hypothetical protein
MDRTHLAAKIGAAYVLGVLRSVGDISPIGAFLVMRLQWLLHDAVKVIPPKAAFVKGFNSSQAKDKLTRGRAIIPLDYD